MRIDCVLLCDAATVREGLLHILGGGVTRVHRPEYPAPLGAALAIRIMIHPTEAATDHQLQALLLAEDGEHVAEIGIGFGVSDPTHLVVGEEASLPISLTVGGIGLPHPGAFSFELLIDGIHQASVPFRAEVAVAPSEPSDDENDRAETDE
jgi:hypothetical protein